MSPVESRKDCTCWPRGMLEGMGIDKGEGCLWLTMHLVAFARQTVVRRVVPLDQVAALPWGMVEKQGADLQWDTYNPF